MKKVKSLGLLISLFIFGFSIVLPNIAVALEPKQKQLLDRGIYYFDYECSAVQAQSTQEEGLSNLSEIVESNGGFSAAVYKKSGELLSEHKGAERPAESASTLKPVIVNAALEAGASINNNDIRAALNIGSSNEAANRIIQAAGINKLNTKIKEIGYKNTEINNLYNSTPANGGNKTSADDVARGIIEIQKGNGAGYEAAREALASSAKAKNGKDYWGLDVEASKWGGTNEVSAVSVLTNEIKGSQYVIGIYVNESNAESKIQSIFNEIQDKLKNGSGAGSPTSSTGNNKVYMVGDSITVGSKEELEDEFTKKDLDITINASESRSIDRLGRSPGNTTSGLKAVEDDQDQVKAAGNIVISLGTNDDGANRKKLIEDLINKIKGYNDSANIYWVNVFSEVSHRGDANKDIEQAADSKDIAVIYADKATVATSGDRVHPTAAGQKEFAKLVADSITDSVSAEPRNTKDCACEAGSSPLTGSDNATKAINFFTGPDVGFSPEQAAGIVGNFIQESGVNPKRVEDGWGFPAEQDTVPPAVGPAGQPGYGIAQWTSPGRKDNLKDFGKDKVSELVTQLEFVMHEMDASFPGLKEELQKIKGGNVIEDTALMFHSVYEGSADTAEQIQERVKSGIDALEKGGGGQGSGGAVNAGCGSQGSKRGTGDFIWPIEDKTYGSQGGAGMCWKGPRDGGREHGGLDIGALGRTDLPALAVDDGTVEVSAVSDGFGNTIVINHGNGTWSLYAHLASTAVKQGDEVSQGDKIGIVGGTGGNYAVHLHFQVHKKGGVVSSVATETENPLDYLPDDGRPTGNCIPGNNGYK